MTPRNTPCVLARWPAGRAAEAAGTGGAPGFDGGPARLRMVRSAMTLGAAPRVTRAPSRRRDQGAALAGNWHTAGFWLFRYVTRPAQ